MTQSPDESDEQTEARSESAGIDSADGLNESDHDNPSLTDALGGLMDHVSSLDLNSLPAIAAGDDQSGSGADHELGEQIEEIADDMLTLMRRVRQIEETQTQMATLVEQINAGLKQQSSSIAREVDALRRDVIGERQHAASTGLFNEMIPLLDRLETSRDHLDADEDARMRAQMDGVIGIVSASLRRLGCEEFEPVNGSAFDPSQMKCAGYLDDGEPGTVLDCVQHGYRVGETVLRPAGVKLLSPTATAPSEDEETDSDE